VVGGLTIPALYERLSMERYMMLASLNLYKYELFYQSFSLTCYSEPGTTSSSCSRNCH
jgi:hypothetical protein